MGGDEYTGHNMKANIS